MEPGTRSAVLLWFRQVLLIDGIAAALTVGFGLFRGWERVAQFGDGLFVAGIIAAGVGLLSQASQSQMFGGMHDIYVQERVLRDVEAITRQNRLDRLQAFSSLIFLGLAGLILAVIGAMLQEIG